MSTVVHTEGRRIGRFSFPSAWVAEYRSEVLRVLGKCAVFRAEQRFIDNAIHYWALCDHFREVPLGELPPRYEWRFTESGEMWCVERAL